MDIEDQVAAALAGGKQARPVWAAKQRLIRSL
jgi:hypothetical protein